MNDQNFTLMYQGIVQEGVTNSYSREAGTYLYDVTEKHFQEQMQWLYDYGYLATTNENLDTLSIPDDKKVLLTFDDGELNNYTQAFPILKQYQFTAYFFIISKKIGKPGYMGWDELRLLYEAGMIIGSHGLTHEVLTGLLDTQIEEELLASKKYLERNLKISVNTLSIPQGFCNEKIIRMAHEIGYTEVFISDKPSSIKSPCFSRIPVKYHWDLKRFQQAVEGYVPLQDKFNRTLKQSAKFILRDSGYDWLRKLTLKVFN